LTAGNGKFKKRLLPATEPRGFQRACQEKNALSRKVGMAHFWNDQ
jgi:hypothetical protein